MTDTRVAQRITAERLLLIGWTRAILLQLAHPLIAAGVYDHSGFRGSPAASASRLHHTVRAMLTLTYGDPQASARTLEGIRTIHRRVNGTLPQDVGPFAAGTRYSAEDPSLVLWVHGTLVESMLMTYEWCVAPLTTSERDAYCRDAAWVAIGLGAVDADVPRTWTAMREYMRMAMTSGAIRVGPQARALSPFLLSPSLGRVLPGSVWLNTLLTSALLPPQIREQYGLELSPRQARRARRICSTLRMVRRFTPDVVALWSAARRAESGGDSSARHLHKERRA